MSVLSDSDQQLFVDIQKLVGERKMQTGVVLSTLISLAAAGIASLNHDDVELVTLLECVDRLSEQYLARKRMMDTTGMQKQ